VSPVRDETRSSADSAADCIRFCGLQGITELDGYEHWLAIASPMEPTDLSSKDTVVKSRGAWIIELAALDRLSRAGNPEPGGSVRPGSYQSASTMLAPSGGISPVPPNYFPAQNSGAN
jgi:hypothetical protein